MEPVARLAPAEIRLLTVAVAALLGIGAAIAITPITTPDQPAGVHVPHAPHVHPR